MFSIKEQRSTVVMVQPLSGLAVTL